MSFGKMNVSVDIITTAPIKDADGFITNGDSVIVTVRAYREDKHGSERWANMAAFSTATAMFRFRRIPNVVVDTTLYIMCNSERFRIVSVEDVRGRGMYIIVYVEKTEGTVR